MTSSPRPSSFAFDLARIGSAILLATVPAAGQQQLRGRVLKDLTHGFQITVPRNWARLPVNVDEKWIISHFLSKKEFLGSAKAGDSLMGHKPYLKVILFDDKEIKKFADVERPDDKTTIKRLKFPYRDYKDYVKRNLSGGGFHFSTEEKGTHRKRPVMRYEVKLAKLAHDKKRYIGWVFRGEGKSIAVEFEVLESQYKKLIRDVTSALRSFKFLEVEKSAPTSQVEDAILRRSYSSAEWAKMSAKERMEVRQAIDKARERKMLRKLPEGWKVTRSEHFLVLSNGSKKYTKAVVDTAETFRRWLNKRFARLSDEYAMKTVIRICKNYEEYSAYHVGSSESRWNFGNREIVTYDAKMGYASIVGDLCWDVYGYYMKDRAPQLLFSAPIWLDSGLDSYVASAAIKGRTIKFPRSVGEFVGYAELRRQPKGAIKTAREILNLDTIGLNTRDKAEREKLRKANLGSQVATFFRFMEGPGKRLKFLRKKDFLIDYMHAVQKVAEEFDAKAGISVGSIKEAETEEEEEQRADKQKARWKEYAEQAKARRKEFLQKLEQHLPKWTEKEWKQLERAFASYHKKKTR